MGTSRVCRAGPFNGPSCSHAPSSSSAPQHPAETSSTSLTRTVNGSHQFKITGYSLSKGLGIGRYLASDTFQVGGYSWAVYFYPDGKSPEDNAAYVSLFIALASEGTDVRALFELTLMDQSGKGRHKVHSHFGRALEGGPYTLKYRGSMWGYKRFFKRTALEASDYLKDDSLLVHCSVGVVRSHTEGPKVLSIAVPSSNIGQHFGQLLETGKGMDVNFEVDSEIISAHKLVLAARSPVFRAQLFGPMKDHNTMCIKVEDMEASVFKVTMSFRRGTLPAPKQKMPWFYLARTPLAVRALSGLPLGKGVIGFNKLSDNGITVMQTDGYEYLKVSCPSLVTELLEYVAKVREHSLVAYAQPDGALDGSDGNGRRVKQRM
ncbi:hypothetical protein Taro_029013 [Colocasia esculenta]|uniref:Uncharacterized protein n=1 Tax=Colocasia esculenta TaxID=4460 RepID=A0A843VS18_COLES|nr:hypothetical protein [Colocasia esculenta]